MEKIGEMSLLQLEHHINRILDERLKKDSMLTMKEAMAMMKVKNKKTFYDYSKRLGLTPKKIGRSVRFSQKELMAKMEML